MASPSPLHNSLSLYLFNILGLFTMPPSLLSTVSPSCSLEQEAEALKTLPLPYQPHRDVFRRALTQDPDPLRRATRTIRFLLKTLHPDLKFRIYLSRHADRPSVRIQFIRWKTEDPTPRLLLRFLDPFLVRHFSPPSMKKYCAFQEYFGSTSWLDIEGMSASLEQRVSRDHNVLTQALAPKSSEDILVSTSKRRRL